MNAHTFNNFNTPALQRSLPDVVAEYDLKLAGIAEAEKAFERAGNALKMACTIGGTFGDVSIDTGRNYTSSLQLCLLRSAWKHVYEGLNLDQIASADDKRKWRTALEKPEPFTLDNIRGTFGRYILDPRGNILRGLAEVFCQLDQAFKSHDKVKVGVKGLPKRIIISGVGGWGSYGRDKLRDMFNALAAYQGRPLIDHKEFGELDALHTGFGHKSGVVTIRGITVKKYQNGNAHVMFDSRLLRDVNKALAEFYGDVLPDTTDEKPAKKQDSTAVAKDLQFYGTPAKVIDDILRHKFSNLAGKRVLEPECGEGAIMEGLRRAGADDILGIEVDIGRVVTSRKKGFNVLHANFLETAASKLFDIIVMNPPFYGRHYAKHVRHAWSLLAPGGTLVAILPATARYDHGELDDLVKEGGHWWGAWDDLPVGSFSASGTNINTTVLTLHKSKG